MTESSLPGSWRMASHRLGGDTWASQVPPIKALPLYWKEEVFFSVDLDMSGLF